MTALGPGFDTVLTHAALASLAGAGAWGVVVVVSLAAEAHTRGRVQLAERLGCPRVVRAWTLAVFVALFAGIAPAQATDAGSGSAIDTALDGLPLPERATGAGPTANTLEVHRVVVHDGDSLWRLAREHLPATASDADVAALVAAVYARDRSTIGPDPDRLRPGQHLDFPDPTRPLEAP